MLTICVIYGKCPKISYHKASKKMTYAINADFLFIWTRDFVFA